MGSIATGADRTRGWRGYGAGLVLVGLATGAGWLTRRHLSLTDLVMLYLLVIMVAAARFGRGPSLAAAALSVLAYDFFFIPPFFTFTVHDERHLLTFAMMFVVGVLISGLTLRIRHQEQASALERARLAEQADAAALRARTEEMRSALLSAVSHDLRTPLAAITGAATTLREGNVAPPGSEQRELLDTICEEADRLDKLVRNLLDMTRLESGALEVKREWVPLEEIVGSALDRLEVQLSGRPIRIDLPADLPPLSADPVLLEQVFVNLLENAAKYTPGGSALEICGRLSDQVMTIEVADEGPGLPAGSEQRVFEKFFRIAKQRGTPGAGLGLAICRGIVGAHGGTLVAENRSGGGALFRLSLPLIGTPPSPPPDLPAAPREGAAI